MRAPGNDVFVVARWLVDDEADLPAVHAIQDGCTVTPSSPVPSEERPIVIDRTDPTQLLPVINYLLSRNPLAGMVATAEELAAVGVGAGIDIADLLPELMTQWSEAATSMHKMLTERTSASARRFSGWLQSHPDLGWFGTNYKLRADFALVGLAGLPPSEVIYFSTLTDQDGEELHGSHRYRFTLPPGGLAFDAFWSLTMYQAEADGRMFMVENPINRVLISDRSPGLEVAADGSVEIAIQVDEPTASCPGHRLPQRGEMSPTRWVETRQVG